MTFGTNERSVEVRDPVGVASGDRVEIGIKPSKIVWASTVGYIFPVVAMLAGGFAGHWLAPEGARDTGAAIGTFSLLALSLFSLWLVGKVTGSRDEELPVIVKVLSSGSGKRSNASDVDCVEDATA